MRVLRRVARLIAEHRRVNVVARYGGESSRCCSSMPIIALHRTLASDCERAWRQALSANARAAGWHADDLQSAWQSCPTDGTSAASLLQAADAALFRAKQMWSEIGSASPEKRPLLGENKAVRLPPARVSKAR